MGIQLAPSEEHLRGAVSEEPMTTTTTCLLDADATSWRITSVSAIPTSAPRQGAFSTLEFGLEVVAPACVMDWWWVKIAPLKVWTMPRFALRNWSRRLAIATNSFIVKIDGCAWVGL